MYKVVCEILKGFMATMATDGESVDKKYNICGLERRKAICKRVMDGNAELVCRELRI